MANDAQPHSESSLTGLVTGIVNDVQELLKQQIALLKHDLRSDIRQTKEAMISLVIGGAVSGLGAVLLSLMLVHLIHWLAAPSLPLWGSYAIVGGAITVIGLGLVYLGVKRFGDLNPLPEQSIEAMKENVRWETRESTTRPTPSANR